MKVFDCALMATTVLMLALAETAYFQGKYLLAIFIMAKGIFIFVAMKTINENIKTRGENNAD